MNAPLLEALLPSPSSGVLHVGPVPLRAYTLCVLLGVAVGVFVGERRWVARGGQRGEVLAMAFWAVPAGVIGARAYHVATAFELFADRPLAALEPGGGLGIWGAIAGGAVGVALFTRRRGICFAPFMDAVAPGVALADSVGRLGNWFNQELIGRPTSLPWGLRIDAENRPPGYATDTAFQPAFLYELLWCVGVAALVVWADGRWRLGRGRAFALMVAAYCTGRIGIELLRIDRSHEVLGVRLNVLTAAVVLVLAVGYLLLRRGRREDVVRRPVATAGESSR